MRCVAFARSSRGCGHIQGAFALAVMALVSGAAAEAAAVPPSGAAPAVGAIREEATVWSATGTGGVAASITYTVGGSALYSVSMDGATWFTSAPVAVHAGGQWLVAGTGSANHTAAAAGASPQHTQAALSLVSATPSTGTDALGTFSAMTLSWMGTPSLAREAASVAMETTIRVYSSLDSSSVAKAAGTAMPPGDSGGAIAFTQRFPNGLSGCALGPTWDSSAQDTALSAFPAFALASEVHDNSTAPTVTAAPVLGFATQSGCCGHTAGAFPADFESGLLRGLPLALYDRELSGAWVLAPLTGMMTSNQVVAAAAPSSFTRTPASTSSQDALRVGLLGTIATVPANFSFDTLLFGSSRGVNAAFNGYGALMLGRHGKVRTAPDASVVVSHLGYSTTAGYFYAPIQNTSYEDTILAVADYAQSQQLPYHYYLLDSWWYGEYQHNGSGVFNWDEDAAKGADPTAPMGRFPHGLKWLSQTLNAKYPAYSPGRFVQHIGKWRADTPYAKNASWDFRVNITSSKLTSESLSASPAFWDWLAAQAADWGHICMKQDHVEEQIPQTPECLASVDFCEAWMDAQGTALAANGATLQAGGYTTRGWLHSVKLPAVTHARASSDYFKWSTVGEGNYWNWDIGPQSMFSWAIGLRPFKDAWYSSDTEKQTNPVSFGFYNWTEPWPLPHAIITALTAGPVSPGDVVKGTNATLVKRTCTKDGLLLKPDRPATAVDAYWVAAAFESTSRDHGGPSVWATSTDIVVTASGSDSNSGASPMRWHYVFGASLAAPYTVTPSELNAANDVWSGEMPAAAAGSAAGAQPSTGLVAFEDGDTGDAQAGPNSARPFDASHPIVLGAGTNYGEAHLWTVAPVLSNGWSVLGESAKVVAVSQQRIGGIALAGAAGVDVVLTGDAGETVSIAFRNPQGAVSHLSCAFTTSGTKTLSAPSGKCI